MILRCPCLMSNVSLSLHAGTSEAQEADAAHPLFSGFPHQTSRLLILWKEQVCVGMASVLLNGRVSMGCMSWHALNFLLPTVSLLLCLAAATSAKGLMALSSVSPQSNQHSWERLWSLHWEKLPGYELCEYSMCVLSPPGKHISCKQGCWSSIGLIHISGHSYVMEQTGPYWASTDFFFLWM